MAEIDFFRVEDIATEVRAFLEPLWAEKHSPNGPPRGKPLSHDMCRFSASFMKQVLDIEMPEGEWIVVGGNPTDGDDIDPESGAPGGYKDTKGRWHGHYWVTDGGYGCALDLTADQFGDLPIVVFEEDGIGSAKIGYYRENYFSGAVRAHLDDVKRTVGQWMALWQEQYAPGWSADGDMDDGDEPISPPPGC